MAAIVTREQAERTLKQAKHWMEGHKASIAEVVKSAEAFGAPLMIGLAEGRLANDGSGHVEIAGVPLMLAAGGLALAGAATGYLDEYGVHAGNVAAGCLGSYGGDLGRELGLVMRAKAGKPTQMALLPPHKVDEIKAYAAQKNVTLQEAPLKGARVGWGGGSFTGEYAVGAAPAPLTADQLRAMVNEG